MPDYRIPKRLHIPENEGAKFAVLVLDGNANEWLLSAGVRGFGSYRPPTPEQHRAIETALRRALEFWTSIEPREAREAEIVPLNRK